MSNLYGIIKINQSNVIVVSKSYFNLGHFIGELQVDLFDLQFSGEIIFDLLLSNGMQSSNRFMISKCKNSLIGEPKVVEKQFIVKYEPYLRQYYKDNISIVEQGILNKYEIQKICDLEIF